MPVGEKILIYTVYYAPLFFAFVCGSVIGSLSNVVIYRLPQHKSIWKPPSHCPKCETRIAWYDNIPIYSWIRLRGKCRHCKAPISPRYIIVEFISGSLYFIVLWVFGYMHLQSAGELPNLSDLQLKIIPILAKAYIFTSLLLILSAIDIDLKILPNRLTFPGMIIGFILAIAVFPEGPMEWRHLPIHFRYIDSLIGFVGGGVALYLIAVLSLFILRKEGMGGGDIKLCAMMGAFLGWKALIVAMFFGFLIGAFFGLLFVILRINQLKSYIPFGPYLAAGAFIAMLFGKQIAWWYYIVEFLHKPIEDAAVSWLPDLFIQISRIFC